MGHRSINRKANGILFPILFHNVEKNQLELKKKMKIGGEMKWKFEIFCMLTEILNKSIQFKIKSVSKIKS